MLYFLTFMLLILLIYKLRKISFCWRLMIVSSKGKVILLFLLLLDVLSHIFDYLGLRNNYETYYIFCSFLLILSCAVSIFHEALISMMKFFDWPPLFHLKSLPIILLSFFHLHFSPSSIDVWIFLQHDFTFFLALSYYQDLWRIWESNEGDQYLQFDQREIYNFLSC